MRPILTLIMGALSMFALMLAIIYYQAKIRRWLKIRVKYDRTIVHGTGETLDITPYIEFVAVNQGTPDVVVQSWGLRVMADTHVFFSLDLGGGRQKHLLSPELPKRLSTGDAYTCGIPKRELNALLNKVLQKGTIQDHDRLAIEFVDTMGKKHRAVLKKTVSDLMNETQSAVEIHET